MKRISKNSYSKPSKTDSISCFSEVTIYTFDALRGKRRVSETKATTYSVLLKCRLFSQHYIEQKMEVDNFYRFQAFPPKCNTQLVYG